MAGEKLWHWWWRVPCSIRAWSKDRKPSVRPGSRRKQRLWPTFESLEQRSLLSATAGFAIVDTPDIPPPDDLGTILPSDWLGLVVDESGTESETFSVARLRRSPRAMSHAPGLYR